MVRPFQFRSLGAIVMMVLALQSGLRADVIDFVNSTDRYPDLSITKLHASYDSANDIFKAWSAPSKNTPTGVPQTHVFGIDTDAALGNNYTIVGKYELQATIDEFGEPGAGFIKVTGSLYVGPSPTAGGLITSGTLLYADLAGFDSSKVTSTLGSFQFRWTNASGILVDMDIFGDTLINNLTVKPWSLATWGADFRTDLPAAAGQSSNDMRNAIPSPAALPAGAMMFVGLLCRRSRRAE